MNEGVTEYLNDLHCGSIVRCVAHGEIDSIVKVVSSPCEHFGRSNERISFSISPLPFTFLSPVGAKILQMIHVWVRQTKKISADLSASFMFLPSSRSIVVYIRVESDGWEWRGRVRGRKTVCWQWPCSKRCVGVQLVCMLSPTFGCVQMCKRMINLLVFSKVRSVYCVLIFVQHVAWCHWLHGLPRPTAGVFLSSLWVSVHNWWVAVTQVTFMTHAVI